MNQTRIKNAPKLTQQMIDNGFGVAKESPRQTMTWKEALQYLDGCPGGWLTLIVVIVFALGMWALFALWCMTELYQAVKSATQG